MNIVCSHIMSRLSLSCLRVSLAAFMLCGGPIHASAQDRLEFGFAGGISYYNGEFNPSMQFKSPGPSLGIVGRYIFTDRLALKVLAGYDHISGSYSSSSLGKYAFDSTPSPSGTPAEGESVSLTPASCSFKNNIIDVASTCEFNFLSFDHMFRKNDTRFSPYLCLGLGLTSYDRYSKDDSKKRVFVLSLPFGVGTKFKVNKLLRLGLEWTFHKTFVDDLDSFGSTSGTFDPSNPYNNGVHKFSLNNDWFSSLNLILSFSMWPRTLVCNDGMKSAD